MYNKVNEKKKKKEMLQIWVCREVAKTTINAKNEIHNVLQVMKP